MKNTKQPNACRQNGLFRGALIIRLVTFFVSLLAASVFAGEKPNVLFIMVDDLNADVGFLGDETAKTPNMDWLAEQGTVFANAHCQAPICGPSRNSLLTGNIRTTPACTASIRCSGKSTNSKN